MANKIQDALQDIKADSRLKESTKQFLSEHRSGRKAWWRGWAFRWAVVAASLVFFVCAGGYFWMQSPVSYVSIDVNPSIELALNRFDRVTSVIAFNDEGREVIKNLSLKGKKYTEAIDELVASSDMKNYLTDKAELVFTVAAGTDREDSLLQGVEGCAGQIQWKSYSFSTDLSIVSVAHGNDISIGKYYAYLELVQYDSSVTVDDCKHMTMTEIHDQIDTHHNGNGQHGGNQQGNGHHS